MKPNIGLVGLWIGIAVMGISCLDPPPAGQNTGDNNVPNWMGNQPTDSTSEQIGGETPTPQTPSTLDDFMALFAQTTCAFYISQGSANGCDFYETTEACTNGLIEEWAESKDFPSCTEPAELYFIGHKQELMDCMDTASYGSCVEGYWYSTCPAFETLYIEECFNNMSF